MLIIKRDVDIKELKKYSIYPRYECDEHTGKTRIYCLDYQRYTFRKLRFKKIKKRIAKIKYTTLDAWCLVIEDDIKELDLDILYDLIKDGLVEKVE